MIPFAGFPGRALNRRPDAARWVREWMTLCSPGGPLYHGAGTVWVSAISALLKLQRSLSDEDPSPIVELMSHQVALCWLDSSYWDAFFYTQAHGDDLQTIDHYDRRRARAARRLARSIKIYAEVTRSTVSRVTERLSRFDLMAMVHRN